MSSLFKSSSSKSSTPKPTAEETDMRRNKELMWQDIKERFWPLDEQVHEQGQRTVGRKAREEGAIGATPVGFNPYNRGVNFSVAGQAADRVIGLRQNDYDRQRSSALNTVATGREIQGQGLFGTVNQARSAAGLSLSREQSKHAANLGIENAITGYIGQAAGQWATKK